VTEALKTWRKRNGSMILATQSTEDFADSDLLRTVLESCPTKFFLANPGIDIARARELFHLNQVEAARIATLRPRQEALLKRPDVSKIVQLNVDPHAQWEIQEFGRVMAGMLQRLAPLSYEAWIDYDVCGARLSRLELDALRRLISSDNRELVAQPGARLDEGALEASGLARREVRELFDKLEARSVPNFTLDLATSQPPEVFAQRFADAVPKVDKPPQE
jgi:hypothetical protein